MEKVKEILVGQLEQLAEASTRRVFTPNEFCNITRAIVDIAPLLENPCPPAGRVDVEAHRQQAQDARKSEGSTSLELKFLIRAPQGRTMAAVDAIIRKIKDSHPDAKIQVEIVI